MEGGRESVEGRWLSQWWLPMDSGGSFENYLLGFARCDFPVSYTSRFPGSGLLVLSPAALEMVIV